MSPHFMSYRLDWRTPVGLYEQLDKEFNFTHDPCPANWDGVVDGLTSEWGTCNYVNPPYGKELPKWLEKSYSEWKKGKTVVLLTPSRTDTRWWHDYCMKATEIRYIKGRLKFDDHKKAAPFPSAVIIFKGDQFNG